MARFRHVTTSMAGQAFLAGQPDLLLRAGPQGAMLYSVTGPSGGVLARQADWLAIADAEQLPPQTGLAGPMGLALAEIGGVSRLIVHGQTDRVSAWRIDSAGRLSDRQDWILRDAGTVLDLETAQIGAQRFHYTTSREQPGIAVWAATGPATLALRERVAVSSGDAANDIFALRRVEAGGQSYLLAVSAGDGGVSSLRIGPDGRLDLVAQAGLRDGLGIATPTQVETVQLAGVTYVVLGAAQSSTLSVFRLQADGRLVATDQVGDDLTTRFQSVGALETVTLDGRAYVIAGGADDGLSLLELLPGGRLLHRDTIADDLTMALTNPGALMARARAGGIDIFAAGQGREPGLSLLRVEPGAAGVLRSAGDSGGPLLGGVGNDTLYGGPGADLIQGGAGADVLRDGAGADVLSGGPGADVFIFTPDGRVDRVTDFEPGIDRLDLSALGRFYDVAALDIRAMPGGAQIRIGAELVEVFTANGRALGPRDFDIGDLRDLWHHPVAGLPVQSLVLRGGTGDDTLIGGAGRDQLTGGAGADVLRGQGGDDLLIGEEVTMPFDTHAGDVFRLYRAVLDRDPDPGGHRAWIAQLDSGAGTLLSVAQRFVASQEFRTRFDAATSTDFVTLLYQNVLGRAPDPGGLAGWTGRLDTQGWSRAEVVLGFAQSLEFRNATAAPALDYSFTGYRMDWSDEVFRLYQATLGRAPDQGGFLAWTAALATGQGLQDVASRFVASAEFQSRYGATGDGAFVTLLYGNVLGRAPEAAGYAGWLARLAGGWSREEVVLAFAQSAEFAQRTAPDLLAWMRARGPDDRLEGGAGNDTLFGGLGADHFVFAPTDPGRHAVSGIERWDWLDFSAFGYDTLAALRAQMTAVEGGTRFADAGVAVMLWGLGPGQIADDMLVF